MSAFNIPPAHSCSQCGKNVEPSQFICPHCRALTYSEQLNQLAAEARHLAAVGKLLQAREAWQAALQVLPDASAQHAAVLREIRKLDARIAPAPNTGPTDWKKRFGPLGVAVATLFKFKGLLLAVAKFKSIFSLVAFFSVYWIQFGWRFAAGIVGSIFLHEMGHYFTVRRFGFAAEMPVFIPGFGAFVRWQGANVDPAIRAQIALAGPLFGLGAGVLSYALYFLTGQHVWLAIAHFSAWLNLANLIPIWILDGASAIVSVSITTRWILLIGSVLLFLPTRDFLLLGIAAATAFRFWRKERPVSETNLIGNCYIGLVVACTFLSWVTATQGRLLLVE